MMINCLIISFIYITVIYTNTPVFINYFVQLITLNLGAPLAPILGQIQVKVQDFITEFNQQASNYVDGLPLSCRIKKLSVPTKFTLKVMPPSWWQLIWGVTVSRSLTINSLYDCFLFRYKRVPHPFEVRSILGILKSSSIKIVVTK